MKRVSRRRLLHASLGLGTLGPACLKSQPFTCVEAPALSVEQLELRNKLLYRDKASNPALACDLCIQYVEPASGARCGSCKIVPGPMHPQGSCQVFAKKS